MYKVIVERPRRGKTAENEASRLRGSLDGPLRLGMRAGLGRPWLNENLAPLRRFLEKQVGRPWNKVFSEITSVIDRRNTVQQHIHQHIEDFIATRVEIRDGRPRTLDYRGYADEPRLRQPLYVDPRTGLVRRNKDYRSWRLMRLEQNAREEAVAATRRRKISDDRWLLKIHGNWFEARIAPLPRASTPSEAEPVFDAVLKLRVRRWPTEDVGTRQDFVYGTREVYAQSKRQLSRRELDAQGLRGSSPPRSPENNCTRTDSGRIDNHN